MVATHFIGNLTKHLTITDYMKNQKQLGFITAEGMRHAEMLEEFLTWLKRDYTINAWWRSEAYNKAVGGHRHSNHLKGTATDISIAGISYAEKWKKYGQKWKEICRKHGVVGEIGIYDSFFHLGSHVTYSGSFTYFDKRTKRG